jgi:hypothetical protein
MNRLLNEPVLLGSAVRAIVVVLLYFIGTSVQGSALVLTAVEAVLMLVTRALVTPNQLAEERVAAGQSPTVSKADSQLVSDATRRNLQ